MSEHDNKPQTPLQPAWRRHLIKVIVILVALASIAAVRQIPDKEPTVEIKAAPPVNVEIMAIENREGLDDAFILPAVIEPNRIVTVSAEIGGRIDTINTREGATVHAGQLLIQINTDLIEPTFDKAKAQLERDQIGFNRMQDLVASKATSQQDLDDASVKLAISKASLAEIKSRYERTSITSPMDGFLNQLHVEAGEYLDPGNPVAQIVDTQTVIVVVEIPERDVSYFSLGQTAEILADIRGTETSFTGTVNYISETANALTRSTRMELQVDNSDRRLRSGQVVRIRLVRRTLKSPIMIPLRAVIPMEEGHTVFVLNGTKAERREVTFGIYQGDRIQVTNGLSHGDQLIISGHQFVAPGQEVNVVTEGQ